MAASPVYIGTLQTVALVLNNASGTTLQTLFTPGASGAKVKSLGITSDDTSSVVLAFAITKGGTNYYIGEVTIPNGSGTNGSSKAVDALNLTDMPWLRQSDVGPELDLANGAVLKVRAKTTITSGKEIHIVGEAGDL